MKEIVNLVLIVSGLLLSALAISEEDPLSRLSEAIKVEDPEKFLFSVSAYDDCPITEDEIAKIAHGVLIRSRLRPERTKGIGAYLYLDITIRCTKPSNGLFAYSSDIYFARWRSAPLLIKPNFGTVGDAGKQTIKNLLKESIERAVTIYIATNFPL